jgi:hypothetical protein
VYFFPLQDEKWDERVSAKSTRKGIIQVPRGLREERGIRKEVSVRTEGGAKTIEPVERVFDRLAGEARFNFKSVATELPKLRKTAEEELLKEVFSAARALSPLL